MNTRVHFRGLSIEGYGLMVSQREIVLCTWIFKLGVTTRRGHYGAHFVIKCSKIYSVLYYVYLRKIVFTGKNKNYY